MFISNVTKNSMITGHFEKDMDKNKKRIYIYDVETGNGILSN
jgi:hypothetical protein